MTTITTIAVLLLTIALMTEPASASDQESPPDPTARVCRMISAVDGDTIRIDCDGRREKVRLYCIDAPERSQEPWGDRSRKNLTRFADRSLLVTTVATYIYGGDVVRAKVVDIDADLSKQQLLTGNAAIYRDYCDVQEFEEAEDAAKKAKLGIWSERGDHQRPWIYRHIRRYSRNR